VGVGILAWRDNVGQRLLYTRYAIRTLQKSVTLLWRPMYFGRLFVTDSIHWQTGADRIAPTSFSFLFCLTTTSTSRVISPTLHVTFLPQHVISPTLHVTFVPQQLMLPVCYDMTLSNRSGSLCLRLHSNGLNPHSSALRPSAATLHQTGRTLRFIVGGKRTRKPSIFSWHLAMLRLQ
jgi:hypothetical protein